MNKEINLNNFFPDGMERGIMKLPNGENFNKIQLNVVKVFVPIKNGMLQCFRYKGGNPELFLDLEKPKENHHHFMKDIEIHFGIRGNFEIEDLFESNVKKNRIDVYIPFTEIDNLINSLNKMKQNHLGEKKNEI